MGSAKKICEGPWLIFLTDTGERNAVVVVIGFKDVAIQALEFGGQYLALLRASFGEFQIPRTHGHYPSGEVGRILLCVRTKKQCGHGGVGAMSRGVQQPLLYPAAMQPLTCVPQRAGGSVQI